MLVFAGEAFDIDNEYKRLKSLLIGNALIILKQSLDFQSAKSGCPTSQTSEGCLSSQTNNGCPTSQTSSGVPLCLQCVWQGWNMFFTSLHWMEKYSCAATGTEMKTGVKKG